MKKSAVIFVTSMFLSLTHAVAQKGFSMGFYLQPQLTSIDGDVLISDHVPQYELEKKQTFGFGFGLQMSYNFTEHLSLSSGVLFSSQGQDYEDLTFHDEPEGNNLIKYSTSVSYVKIPLLVEYLFNPDHKIAYQVYGGMFVGFLSSYEINTYKEVINEISGNGNYGLDMTATNTNVSAHVSTSGNMHYVHYTLNEEPYNSFDYGAQVGAGVVFNCSDKFSIPVSVNYEFSFTNMKNSDSYWSSDNGSFTQSYWDFFGASTSDKFTNSVLGFRVGIRMKIGANPNFD